VKNKSVYRTDRLPKGETRGLSLLAAQLDLLTTVGATVAHGSWLNAATDRCPAVVLGATAAQPRAITSVRSTTSVTLRPGAPPTEPHPAQSPGTPATSHFPQRPAEWVG
jgi:hypothetical protein